MVAPHRPRRIKPGQAWLRALEATKILEQPEVTLPSLLPGLAADYGDNPALIGPGTQLTYNGLSARANRYGHWAQATNLGPGAVICLLMQNAPDYAAIWLGLTATGCVVALLNTNLTSDALAHCIRAAGARHIIAAAGLLPAITDIQDKLPDIRIHVPGRDLQIENFSAEAPNIPKPPTAADTALLIYTSGTTGLPKAAKIPHSRLVSWSFWFAGMMDAGPADRLYNCLPMYHSVGGVVAVGAMLAAGGAVVIRERFSASRFWDDIVDENCTIFQYIGELCRYLNNTPPHPRETQHRLRLACGNGLRGDIWEAFQSRFEIPQILEFYAATEGGLSLYNAEGKPGAIGRVPPYLAHRFPAALIRIDPDTGIPERDESGFCIACAAGEPGEAIGKLFSTSHQSFYTDAAASARKILENVFETGDRWFRTGDLMRKDSAGYYYFVDRLGDTFRWKGENVSTTEVAAVIAGCPGVTEAIVYGVAIPDHEGRAGMAAITVTENFDIETLTARLAALPGYARPVFIRVCASFATTGTFKPIKADLAREAIHTTDPVWFNDRASGRFVPLDAAIRANIEAGTINI
jgi:fatty-acyl-CoA synthase